MTPDRLESCLSALHWSPDTLAHVLGCKVALIEDWLTGERDIPPKAAAWIEVLARVHEAAEGDKPRSLGRNSRVR